MRTNMAFNYQAVFFGIQYIGAIGINTLSSLPAAAPPLPPHQVALSPPTLSAPLRREPTRRAPRHQPNLSQTDI